MSLTVFYRDQAEQQRLAASGAALANVRDRCQRASNAWDELAQRSERNDVAREDAASKRPVAGIVG